MTDLSQIAQQNMFDDADSIRSVVYQAIGAGSMCWTNVSEAGEFDSTQAARIGDDALGRIHQLLEDLLS